jgi:predicted ester cyclase
MYITLAGCEERNAVKELSEFKAQVALEEQNKQVVRRLFDELNKGNFDIYDELFALDFTSRIPSSAEPRDLEGHKAAMKQGYSAMSDLKQDIVDIFADGDKVVIRTTGHAVQVGQVLGIQPTGKEIGWTAIAIFKLANGKIKEIHEEIDMLGLYQKVGMTLKPSE